MTASGNDKLRPIPEGYHSVTPWIISRDSARLIEFLSAAFGAEEIARVVGEDGSIGHAEVRIGDSVVMMFDAKPHWPDTPAFLRLYVADGDAVFQQALRAGATSVTEMTHLFWGDRVGRVRDPFGNLWWIQTRSRMSVSRRWNGAPRRRSGSMRWIMSRALNSFLPPVATRASGWSGDRGKGSA